MDLQVSLTFLTIFFIFSTSIKKRKHNCLTVIIGIKRNYYLSYEGPHTLQLVSGGGGGASSAPTRPWAVLNRLMGLEPSVIRVDLSPRAFSMRT